jgi:hypothetical protein
MLHERRVYQVAEFPTVEALAREIMRVSTWTLCSAFAAEGLTLFNDSLSENGAQEYAVYRGEKQIESLTTSWMTEEQLVALLRELAAGGGVAYGGGRPSTDHGSLERCMFCA